MGIKINEFIKQDDSNFLDFDKEPITFLSGSVDTTYWNVDQPSKVAQEDGLIKVFAPTSTIDDIAITEIDTFFRKKKVYYLEFSHFSNLDTNGNSVGQYEAYAEILDNNGNIIKELFKHEVEINSNDSNFVSTYLSLKVNIDFTSTQMIIKSKALGVTMADVNRHEWKFFHMGSAIYDSPRTFKTDDYKISTVNLGSPTGYKLRLRYKNNDLLPITGGQTYDTNSYIGVKTILEK